jgi:hypothetical protein
MQHIDVDISPIGSSSPWKLINAKRSCGKYKIANEPNELCSFGESDADQCLGNPRKGQIFCDQHLREISESILEQRASAADESKKCSYGIGKQGYNPCWRERKVDQSFCGHHLRLVSAKERERRDLKRSRDALSNDLDEVDYADILRAAEDEEKETKRKLSFGELGATSEDNKLEA